MENQLLTGGREGKIALNKGRIVRPANPWTKDVHAFLRFLKQKGFENVPVPYGVNGDGKEEVSFVEGVVYNDCLPDVVLREDNLLAAARLLRRYHDAGAEYAATLAGGETWMLPGQTPAEVMCHGDFAPYNVTFVDGRVSGMIDFDTLHPGPRVWDIAYGVYRWVPFVSPGNPDFRYEVGEQIRRMKAFADAYGMTAEQRGALPGITLAQFTEKLSEKNKSYKSELKKAEKEIKTLSKETEKTTAELTEGRKLNELIDEYADKCRVFSELTKRKEEFEIKQKQLSSAQAAQNILPDESLLISCENRLSEKKKAATRLENAEKSLKEMLDTAKKKLEAAEKENKNIDELKQKIIEIENNLPFYDELEKYEKKYKTASKKLLELKEKSTKAENEYRKQLDIIA